MSIRTGGSPPAAAVAIWFSGLTRHSIASKASSWFSENAETPRLMPPSGGALGVPGSTAGYLAAFITLKMSGASASALG